MRPSRRSLQARTGREGAPLRAAAAASVCLGLFLSAGAAARTHDVIESAQTDPGLARAAAGGERVSIEVVDRRLGDVLEYVTRVSGLSIVTIPESIKEEVKVTLSIKNVYWRVALGIIADKYNLVIDEDEIRWRVLTITRPKPFSIISKPDADAKDIFAAIATEVGVSIVIPEGITQRVTVYFDGIPWPDALEEVARAAGVVVVRGKRGVIRIAKPEDLETQMETRVFQLSYLQAGTSGYRAKIESDVAERIKSKEGEGSESLKDVLEKVKSEKGTVAVLKGTNSIVVTDTLQKLETIEKLVRALDRPPKEVHLSVKILELTDSDAEEIGILWANGITGEASGMSFNTMFPFSPGSSDAALSGNTAMFGLGALSGVSPGEAGVVVPKGGSPVTLSSPNYVFEDAIGSLTLGTLSFAKLTALLQFIRTQTTGRVVLSLQIIALDHEEATIHVGELVRYAESRQTVTETGAIASGYQESGKSPVRLGIQLLVIPHVTGPDNNVILTVIPATETAAGATLFEVFEGGPLGQLKLPHTRTRTVVTKMMLRDRETGIIAGLRQQSFGETITKIPVLGDIPLIGWLFRQRSRPADTNKSSNLLILITPTVIDFEKASEIEGRVKSAQEELGKGYTLEDEAPPDILTPGVLTPGDIGPLPGGGF